MKNKYHLTFDIDWAPDSSIQLCLDMLSEYKVKATFFTLHHTDLNKEILQQGHELGIHPNFLPNSNHGKSTSEVIDKCLSYAPNARFMRTHCLIQSSPLLAEIFGNYDQLTTDLSLFMHEARHVQKCKFTFGGISFDRILYNWEDDAEFIKDFVKYDEERFYGDITIFDFHPIHVHLNSTNGTEYSSLKEIQNGRELFELNANEVEKHSNPSVGVRDFLRAILESNGQPISLEDI
ncbi:MAG: polysaccharide deacetylase family protein [Nitrospinota bacterium]